MRRAAHGLAWLWLLAGLPGAAHGQAGIPAPPAAAPVALPPHTVVYRVAFKGFGAGELELRLTRGAAPGSYRYESIPHPSLLARMVVSADSRERSDFTVGAAGVVPAGYHLDDGGAHKGDLELHYDWEHGRVRGRFGERPIDLPLAAGTQDVMSIRAAILADLAAGRTSAEYAMIDQDELKTFVYREVGRETIDTAQGRYDTVVWVSARKGADARAKTWKYWYAPALGYLPVRAEQLEEGRTRISFTLRSARLD